MVDQIIHVGSVTSTSDMIRSLWRKCSAGEGLVPYKSVLADHQTEGRGRLGRTWTTPPKKALLMSTVVPVGAATLPWVSLLSGLAIRALIVNHLKAGHGREVRLKWPNDVLIQGKKVAGVLCEYLGSKGKDHFVSVGIGLNLTQTADELPTTRATSLALEGGLETDRRDLAEAVRSHLTSVFAPIDAGVTLQELQEEYRRTCVTLGTNVTVTFGNARITGAAIGINMDGRLVIEDAAGATHIVQAGHVAEHHRPHLTAKEEPEKESAA